MSAFLCSDRHLSALVNAHRMVGGRHILTIARYLPATATPTALAATGQTEEEALFNVLFEENLASIAHRYPDAAEVRQWREADAPRYDRAVRPESVVAALALIDCYEYQSCEHPGWHDSEAWRYCHHLRKYLIAALPGYDEAPWSI